MKARCRGEARWSATGRQGEKREGERWREETLALIPMLAQIKFNFSQTLGPGGIGLYI
jgi:hypothetical protein